MRLQELLTEGGNLFPSIEDISRIQSRYISSTVESFGVLAGIPKKDLHLLGSTGKRAESGDIDIGVEIGNYDPELIHKRLRSKLGDNKSHFQPGLRIYSYAVPIVKKVDNDFVPVGGTVQVDVLYLGNVNWGKFAYHSEGDKGKPSHYKGAIRTILLKAIASAYAEEGVDLILRDPTTKQTVIRIGRTFDPARGFRRIYQIRPLRVRRLSPEDSPFLANMKTVYDISDVQPILDALKKMYPGAFDYVRLSELKDQVPSMTDPEKFLKTVIPGRPVTSQEVSTAEDLIRLIQARFDGATQERIFRKAQGAAKGLERTMRVPDFESLATQSKGHE